MEQIVLYRYKRENGGVTISPEKPVGTEYDTAIRLVAGEGMLLTNGEKTAYCTDVEDITGWYEIIAPTPTDEGDDATDQDYLNALNELGVNTDEA